MHVGSGMRRRVRRQRVPRASPRTLASSTVGGHSGGDARAGAAPPGRADRAPAAPTPACTPGARSSRSTRRSRPSARPRARCSARSTGCAGRRSSCATSSSRADDFDARFSATGRRYRYTVLNRAVPDPFLAATTWHVPDAARPRAACGSPATRFIGEHDFSSFCRRPKADDRRAAPHAGPPGRSRALGRPRATALLRFEIEANAFCHQMVRAIVGHAGRGRPGAQARRARRGDPAGPGPRVRGRRWRRPRPLPVGGGLSRRRRRAGRGLPSREFSDGADGLAVNPRLARDSLDP